MIEHYKMPVVGDKLFVYTEGQGDEAGYMISAEVFRTDTDFYYCLDCKGNPIKKPFDEYLKMLIARDIKSEIRYKVLPELSMMKLSNILSWIREAPEF